MASLVEGLAAAIPQEGVCLRRLVLREANKIAAIISNWCSTGGRRGGYGSPLAALRGLRFAHSLKQAVIYARRCPAPIKRR